MRDFFSAMDLCYIFHHFFILFLTAEPFLINNLFNPSACKLVERMLKFLHVIVVLNRRKNPLRKKHGMQVCL